MINNQKVKWIWSDINDRSKDCYKLFRASFTLDKVPEGTAIEIAVDSTFALYVNGKRIPCGQFSDYPEARNLQHVPPESSFETEDSELARLNRLGRRAMMLCMHEHYEDCPWREQALWNFDTRIQMFLGYHVWGNYDFAAASLRMMQKSYCDGFLALTEPGRGDGRTIPSFSLAYIVGLRDLLLYGGNVDQVVGHLDTVDGILDFGLARRDKNGLCFIEENKRFWNFYEWIGQLCSLNEFPQSLWNLYFGEALKSAGFINRVCGREERADFF